MTVLGQTQGSQGSAEEGSGNGSEPPEQTVQRIETQNNNNNNNNRNMGQPPAYPCNDVCINCGKKVTEIGMGTLETESTSEDLNPCSCECHKQLNNPHLESVIATQSNLQNNQTLPVPPNAPQSASTGLPAHIPPAGPDCLPGCGYSGLPCYNCSLRPTPPQGNAPLTGVVSTVPQNTIPPSFIPHVYTVELQDNMMGSSHAQSDLDQDHVVLQGEEDPRAKKRRRTCLSILIAIITVNVAFQMFKLL